MNYIAYTQYLDTFKKLLEKEGFRLDGFQETIANIRNSQDLKYTVKPIKLVMRGKFPKRLSHTVV